MVDLRLLGITERNSAMSALSREVLPYTWIAFVVSVVSGTLLFISNVHAYLHDLPFDLKFVAMAMAGVNMAVFHLGPYRHVAEWDHSLPPPMSARMAGALSMLFWILVIFFGRWIGFTLGP
jgi:hypothetical protein